jgi:hypothetical protein
MSQPPVPGPPTAAIDTVAINEGMARLAELDTLDVSEHPARFEAVHSALTDALSAVDRI